MKKASLKQKRTLSQKGFSPIYVIVGVVVLAIAVFALYSKNSQNSSSSNSIINNDQTQTAQPQAETDKIEGDTYTFYYPNDFIKLDKKRVADTVLYYGPPPSKASIDEGISLSISFVSKRMDTPSSEFCKEMLQFSVRGDKNIRIVTAQPVDFIKSHGCDFNYVRDYADKKVVFHEKPLWFKEGDDLLIYDVTGSYLTTTSQDQQNSTNDAVDQFILK